MTVLSRLTLIAALAATTVACGPRRPAASPIHVGAAMPASRLLPNVATTVEEWGWRIHGSSGGVLVVDSGCALRGEVVTRELWTFRQDGDLIAVERLVETLSTDGLWRPAAACDSCDRQREREVAGNLAISLAAAD